MNSKLYPTQNKPSTTNAMKTLMAAALALPAIQSTRAETPITKPETDFRYTRYNEGRDRYQIDIYNAVLKIPLNAKMDLVIKAKMDTQTGASTSFYVSSALYGGSLSTLTEVRTGATIYNNRREGSADVRFFKDENTVILGVLLSEETHYESKTVNISYEREFNKNNTSLSIGYRFSDDAFKPIVQANTYFTPRTPDRRARISHYFTLMGRQDLTTKSLIQAIVEFSMNKGYLDDPYKIISIWGNSTSARGSGTYLPTTGTALNVTLDNDKRPAFRGTLALGATFIQHITPLNSSFHIGYRYIKNTWHIRSHTFNLEYYQSAGDSCQIVPSVRYYTQGEAYFYAMAFDYQGGAPFPSKRIFDDQPASSDYRLARYGSITGELKIIYKFFADQSGKFTFSAGAIDRRNRYRWGKKAYPENPTNNFTTYYSSIGVGFVF